MNDHRYRFGKSGNALHRALRGFALAVFLLFAFAHLPTDSWGQGKTDRIPIQKQPTQSAAKPAEKKETKETPKPQTLPPVRALQVPDVPGPAVDFEVEMKRLESLLSLNDRNAEAHYNRAWLYEYKGDMPRAVQDYTKAIELDKKLKDAYFNRALLFAKMKRYEEALKDLSEVIKMEPASTDAFCNRGNILSQMGKMDLALADYQSGLKVNPNDADLLYNRALIYLAQGNKAGAMEDLKKSAQMFHDKTRKAFPELAPPVPVTLKQAALECRVSEFLNYMPPPTKERVQKFEELRVKVDALFEDLFKGLKQSLGDKVQRQKNSLALSIEGTDPRWTEIFGPKWSEIIRQNPREPRFFYLTMEFKWSEECQILQRFQACLENSDYCQETGLRESALQMKRVDGSWELVDGKEPEEWKQAQAMGEGFVEIIQWVKKFFADNKGKMAYEEMMLSLARAYTDRLIALSSKVKSIK